MIPFIYNILAEGYQKDPENKIYPRLIETLVVNKGVPDVSLLFSYLISDRAAEPNIYDSEFKTLVGPEIYGKDLRLKCTRFRGFKKFRHNTDPDIIYGLDFTVSNLCYATPASTVIVGQNGIGKTSCFVATEISTTHDSAVARYHNEDPLFYITNVFAEGQPAIAISSSEEVEFNYNDVKAPVMPPAFFCSPADVDYITKNTLDKQYILKQLGEEIITELLDKLRNVIQICGEILTIIKINRDLKSGIYQKNSPKYDEIIRDRKWFRNKCRKIFKIPKNHGIPYEKHLGIGIALQDITKVYEYLENIINSHISIIHDLSNKYIHKFIDPFLSDNFNFRISILQDNIKMELVSSNNDVCATVKNVLNTFNLKLLTIAIKYVLSCVIKKIRKLNFPFVLDDIFDASDFSNKYRIQEFFSTLFDSHDEQTDFEKSPLQMICYTQDEIVAQSIYKGITHAHNPQLAKYVRLFEYNCATKLDVKHLHINKNNVTKFINLFHEIESTEI